MKKYLFGLGAMLIGAGLMFVFTHTEVSASGVVDSSSSCETIDVKHLRRVVRGEKVIWTEEFLYCKIKDLTCVGSYSSGFGGLQCLKTNG